MRKFNTSKFYLPEYYFIYVCHKYNTSLKFMQLCFLSYINTTDIFNRNKNNALQMHPHYIIAPPICSPMTTCSILNVVYTAFSFKNYTKINIINYIFLRQNTVIYIHHGKLKIQ